MNLAQRKNIKTYLSKANIPLTTERLDRIQKALEDLNLQGSVLKGPIAATLAIMIKDLDNYKNLSGIERLSICWPAAECLAEELRKEQVIQRPVPTEILKCVYKLQD